VKSDRKQSLVAAVIDDFRHNAEVRKANAARMRYVETAGDRLRYDRKRRSRMRIGFNAFERTWKQLVGMRYKNA